MVDTLSRDGIKGRYRMRRRLGGGGFSSCLTRARRFAWPVFRAHDLDVHEDGLLAPEHARQHRDARLREGIGRLLGVLAALEARFRIQGHRL